MQIIIAFDDLQLNASELFHPGDELSTVAAISPNLG
jgi:hypothetical protein